MLFPKLLLCTVAALAWGYGNDNTGGTANNAASANANSNYGSSNSGGNGNANPNYGAYPQPIYMAYDDYSSEEDHHHHKKSCKSKLHHYDLTAKDPAHSILEAKWKPVEKDGKDFTLITCPADCKNCALVAESEGNSATISATTYSDTALLANGLKPGILAKCHGKRTTFELDSGEKVLIKNVACVKYPETPLPCTLCNVDLFKSSTKSSFSSIDQIDGHCKKTVVTCTKNPGCNVVQVKTYFVTEQPISSPPTPSTTPVVSEFICHNDGTYRSSLDDFTEPVTKIECVAYGSGSCR